jgi:CRP-like cAMP-binding protein/Fe-S-cluster-containing hydrogenase component 2
MTIDTAKPPQSPLIGVTHRKDVQPLSIEEVRFEIDMCIGCDRCMRACPVPLSSKITIAELNRATVSDKVSPQVARFTTECVMCGSCVPVCPVDNHRDLLMLSLKQRLGIDWDGRADITHVRPQLPPGWDLSRLLRRLREQPIFQDIQQVPDNYLLHCIATSKLLSLAPDEVILREGEFGRDIYFILEGQVELSLKNADGQSMPISILQRGEYMGEQSMLTGQPRSFSARALGQVSPPPRVGQRPPPPRVGQRPPPPRVGQRPPPLPTEPPTPTDVPTRPLQVIVLQVPEQVMQHLMEIAPSVEAFFDQVNTPYFVETVMKRLPLFQGVSSTDLRRLIERMQLVRYERGEKLFDEVDRLGEAKQGQPGRETLHILLEGFVSVARRIVKASAGSGRAQGQSLQASPQERIIAYRQAGDYFAGGLDMLGDRRSVSVSAITRVTVAEFSRATMMALFKRYPEILQRFRERLALYKDANAAANSGVFGPDAFGLAQGVALGSPEMINALSQPEARAGLHALVDDGVVEGTDVLVIDLDKCIHCNECEEACARRHGHSRMNRRGMVVGNINITTSCRQCQDPVCMLCSRAGIARLPSGEVCITESCIGCGICAERCPYNNISIVSLDRQETPEQSSWQRFSSFFKQGTGKERSRKFLPMAQTPPQPGPLEETGTTDALTEIRKKIAVKCDLCAGYNNQACVQACPVGAAFRVNPVTFFGSTEDILSRRV